MVLLDVVYNHFGPEGNFLPACTPAIFTERHHTPWGAAINYDGPESATVRELAVHNALYWIEEFHLDGLRLDAVHAILDDSPKHLLAELAERVRAAAPEREVHLIVENEENEATLLTRDGYGRPLMFDAQWNDDVHHVLHTAATTESSGYYADYCGDTQMLGRALAEGFAFQGEVMAFRGSARGEPAAHLPPSAFVAFLQNHDQIGNRAFGQRIGALAAAEAVRALTAVYLLLPQVPLLFMGEEWAAAQPFRFFCDFSGELGDAVRAGRRAEFARFPEFADPARRDEIPDPIAPQTFADSKLVWNDREAPQHARCLDRYRGLLAVRRREIVPRLPAIVGAGRYTLFGSGAVAVEWTAGAATLCLTANLSDAPAALPPPAGRELWREGEVRADGGHDAWAVRWSIDDAREHGG
jgi:maltooligosyltrehalose trehalohydrolase